MKQKSTIRFASALTFLVVLTLVVGLLTTNSGQVAGQTKILPTPSKSSPSEDTGKIGESKYSARVEELYRVLGIPKEELAKLGQYETRELIVQNADQLGVRVYDVVERLDEKGSPVKDERGNTIYDHILVAGDKIFKAPSFNDEDAEAKSTPTPFPYPPPQKSYEPGLDTEAYGNEPMMFLDTVYKTYLPIIQKSDVLLETIYDRMEKAKQYVDNQYEGDNYSLGVIKEYPGCPVSIRASSGSYPNRLAGHYIYLYNTVLPVSQILSHIVGVDYDWTDITFEAGLEFAYNEPYLYCDVIYYSNGTTQYQVSKVAWEPNGQSPVYALYLGDTLLYQNIANVPNGSTMIISKAPNAIYSSSRFTIRHATKLGALFYEKHTDPYKVYQLSTTINSYGFGSLPDIYAPLFESGTSASDSYFFTYAAYHDCDLVNQGVTSTIPPGYSPYRYAYESKVCSIGRGAYISLSRLDYLVPALQAIHILNKYNDPDHYYTHPSGGSTTPRAIARWLETKWNGYGIPVYLKSSNYASGIRTNAFLGLESILGYKYGDPTSRYYADTAAEVLTQVQWGSYPYGQYWGETYNDGYLFRPIFQGGQMLMWELGNSYPFSLPESGILGDIVDMFSMPNETIMPIPTNSETTLTYWAALNLYQKYKSLYD